MLNDSRGFRVRTRVVIDSRFGSASVYVWRGLRDDRELAMGGNRVSFWTIFASIKSVDVEAVEMVNGVSRRGRGL